MPVRIVNSKRNARLKELRRTLANPGRERLAGIEGPHLVEEALRAGLRVDCVFAAQGSEPLLDSLRFPPETEILLLPKPLLDAALTTETPQPLAALVEPPQWNWGDIAAFAPETSRTGVAAVAPPLVLVLAGLQDPGNLGTIIRSAEAFGASGIISLPGTVSAWNPKAVRASAGSVFRMPLMVTSERNCLERLREAGVKIFVTAVHAAAQPSDLVDMRAPAALIIGNEGSGVQDELAAKADARITIPCPGPVESLNAAVAASVLLYEAARQRAKVCGGAAPRRGARR